MSKNSKINPQNEELREAAKGNAAERQHQVTVATTSTDFDERQKAKQAIQRPLKGKLN